MFRTMDVDGTGFITADELSVGLQALNVLLAIPLSQKQIEKLHSHLDKNGDGMIYL